ncbi:ATP-dependent DNA helicase Q4 [Ochlerotatus camptorhynchus]|uniref:ATP-dependent DNA helicase Q4 n=1 Tax=Ochlerotatus camptorhynchus TaxID=644619 RepID=UPI0031E11972
MEDPVFKTKYQKYKYKVKLWEKEFRKRNGRIPSKHDIRDSPAEVRDSYKMYYKLKTSLLENTLHDALDDDDDFDSSLVSQMEGSLSQDCSIGEFSNLGEIKASNVSISALLTDQIEGKVTEFEAEQLSEQNANAWGKDLTRRKPVVEQVKEKSSVKPKARAPTKLLMEASAMVPKRNPRKSLSSSRLSSSSSLSASFLSSTTVSSWKDSLPDLETLLNEKSKQAAVEVSPSQSAACKVIQEAKELVNQLDEGWLNRQSGEAGVCTPVRNSSSQAKTFGLRNVNLSALDSPVGKVDSCSSFGMSSLSVNSFVDEGIGSEFEARSNPQIVVAQSTAYDLAIQSDSDGVVENSEDETTGSVNGSFNSGRVRHVAKKRKVFTSVNFKAEAKCSEGDVVKKDLQVLAASTVVEGGVENQDPTKGSESLEDAEPKPKRGRKKAPAKPKAASKARVTKAPVRRTTRGRKPVQYSQQVGSEEETGDFDPDDEDKDPDFKESSKDHSTFEDLQQVKSPPKAKANVPVVKSRKKAEPRPARKSAAKQVSPSSGGERKRRSGSFKKSPVAPRIGGNTGKGKKRVTRQTSVKDHPKDEPVKEDEFDDYVLEFGIESLNNAPRVDIGELKKSTQVVENFIQGVPMNNFKTKRAVEGVKIETTKEAVLRKKAAAGKLNENFVRIDLRKKVFVRGKKTVNYSKYKKSLWKKKKAAALSGPEMDMGGCDGGVLTCFQCGGVGHMARSCKVKGEQLLPLDADGGAEESSFPTLDEAECMAKAQSLAVHANKIEKLPAVSNPLWKLDEAESPSNPEANSEYKDLPEEPVPDYIGHAIPQDFLKKSGILEYTVGNKDKVGPLYQMNSDGSLPPTPKEVQEALKMFGHQQFRAGQERAVMRILCGMSTLVTLSTGSGKSLCYQLPAYLYRKHRKCITLVISPLVSLMEDQVHGVPDFLNAQCLHTNQSPKVRAKTMAAITDGELDVLLISPEAVVSGEKSTGFGSLLRQLPPIAFACIDEAHCVSQWSHNFRPSYLMICRVLKEKLGVHTILGLTATATVQTRLSIVEHLAVPDGTSGIISDTPLPDNLILTVSKDANRDAALLHLLQSDRFSELRSIIVYCTRRDECERIAAFLRTCFQEAQRAESEETGRKRKRVNYTAEPYHAGLSSARRRTIQNAFMSGELRIVVATIAFGMGINKADIRAIIHYNMPKNFESYVQEVGRAGRDGNVSHCHVFLDCHGKDRNELRRHIYANSIDRHVIRKLLQKIFMPCACAKNFKDEKFSDEHRKQIEALNGINWSDDFDETMEEASSSSAKTVRSKRICPGHEACFSVESTVQQLDIPEENIATLLCYLELHEQRYIHVLSKAYVMSKVMSYAGPKALRNAAKDCPPLAMAIALELKKGNVQTGSTFIEFPVIDVASAIGWDSGVVKFQLKNLEWTIENNARQRSPISVSFFDLGFRIRAPGDLTDEELDKTLDSLYDRVSSQERAQLLQLQCVSHALSSVAFQTYLPISRTDCPQGPSDKLKTIVREYFQTDISNEQIELIPEMDDTPDSQLLNDIRTLIHRYPENNFSGRAVARIFHGVQSPNYPAVIWGRSNFWRAYTSVDFNRIVRMANAEIVRMRT